MKHYLKEHTFFLILNGRFWDFKPLSEKEKPTIINIFLDKPKALTRNASSQPFSCDPCLSREVLLVESPCLPPPGGEGGEGETYTPLGEAARPTYHQVTVTSTVMY